MPFRKSLQREREEVFMSGKSQRHYVVYTIVKNGPKHEEAAGLQEDVAFLVN